MGNIERNSLPACQLARLQNFVNDLYIDRGGEVWNMVDNIAKTITDTYRSVVWPIPHMETSGKYPIPFWIDTLCVPKGKDGNADMRNLAISRMRRTYESAHRVLVLDSGIQQGSRKAPIAERGTRLYSSRWQHRLWTFQEGALAKNLHFQFSDGALYSRDIEREIDEMPHLLSVYQDEVAVQTFRILKLCHGQFTGASASRCRRMEDAWKELATRSTSEPRDETTCLSTILGIDPTPLLELHAEERMEKLLQLVGELPTTILFHFHGPKLEKHGFSWAPVSFLGSVTRLSAVPLDKACESTCTLLQEGGLSVILPGFRFECKQAGKESFMFVITFNHETVWISGTLVHGFGELILKSWDENAHYAVILSRNMQPLVDSAQKYIVAGCLVTIEDASDPKFLHVKYEHPVMIGGHFTTADSVDTYAQDLNEWKFESGAQGGPKPGPIMLTQGEWLPANQNWIVY